VSSPANTSVSPSCKENPAPRPATRQRVLQTAIRLFYTHGIHAVGIDRIIAESGVAKMTFYRHFPSKSKLVAAYLEHQENQWQEQIGRFLGDPSLPPMDRILGVFDGLHAAFQDAEFRGCAFSKSLAECRPDREGEEVQHLLRNHFLETEKRLSSLVEQIRPHDYKQIVGPIVSLIVGSAVITHATGPSDIVLRNKQAARLLLTSP
jgi:AcrR family transcriptional regulator